MSQANKNRKRGKRVESEIVKRLGGKRRGILGGEDIEHEHYSIEVKSREKHAIFKWFDQCKNNNVRDKMPLLVCHEHGKRYDDALVCMTLKDFENMKSYIDLLRREVMEETPPF
jgi:hypothetical protein